MHGNHALRRQVTAELKRRRYVIFTVLLLCLVYVWANLVLGDSGLMRFVALQAKEAELSRDLARLDAENEGLRSTISASRADDFVVEKHAREEFGLAGPDEFIYIYRK